jgi:hypothetical protein
MHLRSLTVKVALVLTVSLFNLAPNASSIRAIAQSRAVPRAVVPFSTFNFGDVYRGEIIIQIFVIKNAGDGELQIKDFKGDCGCTTVRSAKVIAPGKEGVVEVEVQTVSLSSSISKNAVVHTNDPDLPTIVFTVVANIVDGVPLRAGKYIGPVFVSPDVRGALYAGSGKKATAEFLITAGNAPVRLMRLEGGTKYFTSQLEVVEPGRTYKVRVESLPVEAGGLYTDQIRVVTDNPSLPAFVLDLALRVYEQE